ncbi:MAG: DUF4390 domain-containing protein [Betaproteobacteria bacterium]|nr:DUF4390 domain-containing protein [Betaproteobacteria bacterium]
MHCLPGAPEPGRRWSALTRAVAAMLVALVALAAAPCGAAELEVRRASLMPGEEAHMLDADLAVELSQRLEEVVSRGVPLHIVADFELTRSRWYWFDEKLAARTLTWRLSYHALTRQYRLSTGALHQGFATLAEALHVLSRVREFPVAEKSALHPGESYQAALRVRVDVARLPKPLQVTAIGSREWNLGSDWWRWTYTVPGDDTAADLLPRGGGAGSGRSTAEGERVRSAPARTPGVASTESGAPAR